MNNELSKQMQDSILKGKELETKMDNFWNDILNDTDVSQNVKDIIIESRKISDENIYDKSPFHDGSDYSIGQHNGFIDGAKWYRKQLRNK